jgi:microcystin-dependent protein
MTVVLPIELADGTIPVADDFMQNYRVLRDAINNLVTSGLAVPTGTVFAFAGSPVPSGYSLCDGAQLSRVADVDLWHVIGTQWGPGDGFSTFNKPDLRGRVIVGVGAGVGLSARTLAQIFGEELHVQQSGELAAHLHGINDVLHNHGITDLGHSHFVTQQMISTPGSGSGALAGSNPAANFSTDTRTTGIVIAASGTGISQTVSAGASAPMNIMQPSACLTYIIKH